MVKSIYEMAKVKIRRKEIGKMVRRRVLTPQTKIARKDK
jgi:hypothetical protein